MIDWLNTKIEDLTTLMRAAAVLVSIAILVATWAKTRALVAVLTTALGAGIFLWAINNTDWLEQRVEEEEGGLARVVVMDMPDPASVVALEAGRAA